MRARGEAWKDGDDGVGGSRPDDRMGSTRRSRRARIETPHQGSISRTDRQSSDLFVEEKDDRRHRGRRRRLGADAGRAPGVRQDPTTVAERQGYRQEPDQVRDGPHGRHTQGCGSRHSAESEAGGGPREQARGRHARFIRAGARRQDGRVPRAPEEGRDVGRSARRGVRGGPRVRETRAQHEAL